MPLKPPNPIERRRKRRTGFGASIRKTCTRAGTVTIEVAVVAPFVFFLIFSSIEFSRMMMIQQALTNAAREGARKASLQTSQDPSRADATIRDVLRPTMKNVDDQENLRVTFSPHFDSTIPSGTRITASIQVDCADVSWAPSFLFGGASIGANASTNRE